MQKQIEKTPIPPHAKKLTIQQCRDDFYPYLEGKKTGKIIVQGQEIDDIQSMEGVVAWLEDFNDWDRPFYNKWFDTKKGVMRYEFD